MQAGSAQSVKTLFLWFLLLVGSGGCTAASPTAFSRSVDVGSTAAPTSGIVFVTARHVDHQANSLGVNWELYLVQADGSGLVRLTDNNLPDTSPSWSPDGRQIAYRSRVLEASSDIFLMDADGSRVRNLINDSTANAQLDDFYPEWSPQGDKIALYTDRHTDVGINGCALHRAAVMDIDGGPNTIKPLDAWLGNQESLAWHPDGIHVAVSTRCHRGQQMDLILWNTESDEVDLLTNDEFADTAPAFSHDGRFLAFQSLRESGGADIFVMDMETGAVRNLTNHPAHDAHPTWSPDDKQIAFVSQRDGNDEIYVINVDGSNPRNLSNHPAKDFEPAWSPVP